MIKSFLYKMLSKLTKVYWEVNYGSLRNKYKINKGFKFNGSHILIYGEGIFSTGQNSYVGSFSTIQIDKNSKVAIGNNCRIGHNVRIYTQSNVPDQDFADYNNLKTKFGDVIIEDNVWIGANVFINPGIIVGENS